MNDQNESPADATPDQDGAAPKSSNPFDFDVDFSVIEKRRERAKAAKDSAKEEAARAILAGMDAVDPSTPREGGLDATPSHPAGAGAGGGGGSRKPNIIKLRAATTGGMDHAANFAASNSAAMANNRGGFFSAFRASGATGGAGGMQPFGNDVPAVMEAVPDNDDDAAFLGPFRVCGKTITVWPYDDYHLVQKMYYEKLEDNYQADPRLANEQKEAAEAQSSIPVFSRPADPPDIPTAVMGLHLTEFERKAEERSIAIISTWLFDAGLIDELLVNGGMTGLATIDSADTDNRSVPSSEGVEVGQHGQPIEADSNKMDKEIGKLRNSVRRQLALINARLNDGVAATGSEVQELVNAVIATKDDIGRLRELSTFVSNASDVDEANQFMLTKYPKLKQAINARRNLARVFRELDFYSQIHSTCDRLREELHGGEWTAHEWATIRSVCREHVELEIFLLEASAGMKKRLEEEEGERRGRGGVVRRHSNQFGRQAFANSGLGGKNDMIDQFLQEHVSDVWELGDEIRIRVMSGFEQAFDLAMNNPAGMVALVEAVEVYENAGEEYRAVHGEDVTKGAEALRFTNMRASALASLYKDFESRGLEVFRELTMQAADIAEEEEAANQQFSAVLRAANELTSEIGIVKDQMAPCFPPNWSIEVLWTTCVAHVCSGNILQQIGGPLGQKLPDLTVTQLLDLVAWVETFREIIEEEFPNIGGIKSSRSYQDKAPKLLADNEKTIDLELAKDSLAWVNRTLWEVHDLAKDEFLYRTKEQTEEWLEKVYTADHAKTQTTEGFLLTSLCEDVYALAGVQLRTIRERLTRKSEALVQAVGVILKNLYDKQMSSRDNFCTDFETCCAAANDFIRMTEKCEEVVEEIRAECNLSHEASDTLDEQAAAVLGLYSKDAVYAAQKTHVYIFEPIDEAIGKDLFTPEWEDNLTSNELAGTLIATLRDFQGDLDEFLDEVMVQKAVEAQVSSAVNFYVSCLVQKSNSHSGRGPAFGNSMKGLARMRGDLLVIREYFEEFAEQMPTLTRITESEFNFLDSVVELLSVAAGLSKSDPRDFIILFQKKIKNLHLTKLLVGDFYHLVNPSEEKNIYDMFDTIESELNAVAPTDEKALQAAKDRSAVPGLRLDGVLATLFMDYTRKRPMKTNANDLAESVLKTWSNFTRKADN